MVFCGKMFGQKIFVAIIYFFNRFLNFKISVVFPSIELVLHIRVGRFTQHLNGHLRKKMGLHGIRTSLNTFSPQNNL